MSTISDKIVKINTVLTDIKNQKNRDVKLIAVTKNVKTQAIYEAIKQGVNNFGENRVQECEEKYLKIIKTFPNISLHMIGHLQRNKVKTALNIFNVIHTVDREKLAKEINKNLNQNSATKYFFVQVNIGEEKQKSGIEISMTSEFIRWCIKDLKINIIGLMCIPPVNKKPQEYFLKLQKLAKINHLKYLSMGMSGDYKEAIDCGSTHIRLGTILFGSR